MATRPIFIPNKQQIGVEIININFEWFPGFSKSQKQKSISSLHNSAKDLNYLNILEVSSKSDKEIGVALSAFNLILYNDNTNPISVESVFQASKCFEHGGPYEDLLQLGSRKAKKDARLRDSGHLISFKHFGKVYPLEPKTSFYDWLYISALLKNTELHNEIMKYDYFTDIEFNPTKSINCQAYSLALYKSICYNNSTDLVLKSFEIFLNSVY